MYKNRLFNKLHLNKIILYPKCILKEVLTECHSTTLKPSFIDVKDAWEGEKVYVLLSKIGPFKIFFGDIYNTGPQREFESEVRCFFFF